MHEFTREDYEHAARAAGEPYTADNFMAPGENEYGWGMVKGLGDPEHRPVIFWNPATDDGDALRLAVKLEIEVLNFNGNSHAGKRGKFWCTERWFPAGDACAATRRAIFRAAIEIGKSMAQKGHHA